MVERADSPKSVNFPSKITFYVVFSWFVSAFAGMMFGYDIGISGGVTSMNDFLIKFFPHVYAKKQKAKENNYCKYDDQMVQLFTSSLYLAALFWSFVASKVCSKWGRKPTLQLASLFFLVGVALSSGAQNLWMLILGRIFLGFGVGSGNESAPLFLSEVAPVKYRGGVNILFQLFVTIGILIANLVNYATAKMHPNGWRVSLGLAGVPAIILFFGSLIIQETPTSLIERGKDESGHRVLRKIRGVDNVDAEFEQIKAASEIAKLEKHPYRKLFKKESWPALIIGILLQVFQQLTGINAIMFYAPVLFQTLGFKSNASLFSSVITGLVNVFSTLVAVFRVDHYGRRKLLLQACGQMIISQVIIGGILIHYLKATGTLPKGLAGLVVGLVCLYVMAFAWSWGPLGWLIPSETFPIETRTAGYAFAVSCNMLFTFIIAQAFLSMLCHMQAGIFFFFAGWILIMGLFVYFLLPETKGVPIDDMKEMVWKKHWVWAKCMDDDDDAAK